MPDASPEPARDARQGGRRRENPVAVEVVRGGTVESRHRAACIVADARGRIAHRWGEADRFVLPRSAIKPIQALPLIETGAAERFSLSDAEIALACASHGGEPAHVAAVEAWLARLDLSEADLECGAHPPVHDASAEALWRAGKAPSQLHNNCSGKHAAMLTTARHLGEPTAGYVDRDHPVQRRVAQTIAEMAGVDVARAPVAVDGCSVPTIGLPLAGLATAMARLADPGALADGRAEACARICAAMAAHPDMVAGSGRFGTALIAASGGAALAKTGAEGVYAVALPALGLGLALKVDDGAARAAEVATAAVLRHLGAIDDALAARLADFIVKPLINCADRRVGEVRAAASWPPASA
ncbi:MAG: asparaginase [Alphaproteobacteria bacterium]